jgi:predicted DNA-binding transcriptional regulator YafY
VHPYRIAYVQNQWMLFAHDPKEKEIVRKFVLFRMGRPELTDERFEISKHFDLNKELEGSLGVFKGSEDFEVVLEFDAWGADDVRGHRWHCSQELTELPKGRLRMRMRLNSLEEVERWVLGFGDHATVIEPRALRDRLKKTAEAIHAKYSAS